MLLCIKASMKPMMLSCWVSLFNMWCVFMYVFPIVNYLVRPCKSLWPSLQSSVGLSSLHLWPKVPRWKIFLSGTTNHVWTNFWGLAMHILLLWQMSVTDQLVILLLTMIWCLMTFLNGFSIGNETPNNNFNWLLTLNSDCKFYSYKDDFLAENLLPATTFCCSLAE